MMTQTAPKGSLLWLCLMVLLLLSGLCTIFAAVVTLAEGWQEHSQAQWPEVIAHVDRCAMVQTSTSQRNRYYYIRCRLIYDVGSEQNAASIYSINVPSPEVAQYPPNQMAPYSEWVAEHPPGTPIAVRYDPANHSKVSRLTIDMPRGGPRTPNNIKLLEAWAGSFVILLTITQLTRSRFLRPSGEPSR